MCRVEPVCSTVTMDVKMQHPNYINRLSILIIAFYSQISGFYFPITHHSSLVSSHQSLFTSFQVILSQDQGVPNQNPSHLIFVPKEFQRNSRFCSKFVTSLLSLLLKLFLKAWFAQAFSQKLDLPICDLPICSFKTTPKLHHFYTEIHFFTRLGIMAHRVLSQAD